MTFWIDLDLSVHLFLCLFCFSVLKHVVGQGRMLRKMVRSGRFLRPLPLWHPILKSRDINNCTRHGVGHTSIYHTFIYLLFTVTALWFHSLHFQLKFDLMLKALFIIVNLTSLCFSIKSQELVMINDNIILSNDDCIIIKSEKNRMLLSVCLSFFLVFNTQVTIFEIFW